MQPSTGPVAVLAGQEALLCLCADELLARGWRVAAVATRAAVVRRWAGAKGIAVVASVRDLPAALPVAADYLFSVTNFDIVPAEVLGWVRAGAFNFHDGPLPEMGGLACPAWAILQGAATHGVTWHRMTGDVDGGAICVRAEFPVDADATAFSLNARCFEAGLESFQQLVAQIDDGSLAARPPRPPLEYFGRDLKPAVVGFIDWTRPAGDIDRLCRALAANDYRNSLASAKCLLDGRACIVPAVELVDVLPGLPPGQVVAADAAGFTVATGEKGVRITRLAGLDGGALDVRTLGIGPGRMLPPAPEAALAALRGADGRWQMNDAAWVTRLSGFEATPLGLAGAAGAQPAMSEPLLQLGTDAAAGARFLGVVALVAGRLNDTDSVCLALGDAGLNGMVAASGGFIAPAVPVRVRLRGDVGGWLRRCAELLAGASAPLAADIGVRFPDVRRNMASLRAAPLRLLVAGSLAEAKAVLAGAGGEVLVHTRDDGAVRLHGTLAAATCARLRDLLAQALAFAGDAGARVASFELLTDADRALYAALDAGTVVPVPPATIDALVAARAAREPDAVAVAFGNGSLTLGELDAAAARIAGDLQRRGCGPGDRVGVLMARSPQTVAVMLGIMKAGAAYVPLDPGYPADRIRFIARDCGLKCAYATGRALHRFADLDAPLADPLPILADARGGLLSVPRHAPGDLAYVIYTSGSTGNPKGVMVTHANVVNFFAGMDQAVGTRPGTMLSVTSISFDISVLELWWTLSRGFKVVLFEDEFRAASRTAVPERRMGFSLYYWNTETHAGPSRDAYRLLLEGARFADANGFDAVWTPERHFGSFGGLYANASVTSAALAAATTRVAIRAGSCVLPLHHPVRVAEEWAMVDNLSQGRVGISFASGWMPNDFVLRPENFRDAKSIMFRDIDVVQRLWRGEAVAFPGPNGPVEVRTLPRPVQAELPVWVTSAGSRSTFEQAGAGGFRILTHLLGQSVDALSANLDAYRAAWRAAGHAGDGHVTLMLHTLVGDDIEAVRELARAPMKAYLRAAMSLVKDAAWEFPTFKRFSEAGKRSLDEYFAQISPEDLDDLLEFAFLRYFDSSGLFGTVERCLEMVDRLKRIGVDEIGCLIDYGIDADTVLAHLADLAELARAANDTHRVESFAELVARHEVTHVQCTPSQAGMFLLDEADARALGRLEVMLVGGEAINQALNDALCARVGGRVINMYGPTETTVWSTTAPLAAGRAVTIGRPIANTRVRVLDSGLRRCGQGVPGQLFIGGDGVTRGYHGRDALTAERFVDWHGDRLYATGDWVRLAADGSLEYLGRQDNQVKIRGYRIELGEIESSIARHPGMREVAVVADDDGAGGKRLVAFFSADGAVDGADLRVRLAARLPEFMVPGRYVQLPELPHTPNGKIDRKALHVPADGARPAATMPPVHAAEGATQQAVLGIWKELLELGDIDATANFFDIGGHSILAMRMQGMLSSTFGRRFPVSDLFRFPTIQALSAHIDASAEGGGAAAGDARGQHRAQRRLDARARQADLLQRRGRRPPPGA